MSLSDYIIFDRVREFCILNNKMEWCILNIQIKIKKEEEQEYDDDNNDEESKKSRRFGMRWKITRNKLPPMQRANTMQQAIAGR